MGTSDPIGDMLTRIRNAALARHPKVDVPASKLKMEIARILKEEGFIMNFKMTEDGAKKSIRIYLKYTPGNVPVISRIERVSRPGCRVYVGSREVPKVLGGLGDQHPDHGAGRDDWQHGAQRTCGRRDFVSAMVGWGGPPGPRPTPSSACYRIKKTSRCGSRGPRADQGVRPTSSANTKVNLCRELEINPFRCRKA